MRSPQTLKQKCVRVAAILLCVGALAGCTTGKADLDPDMSLMERYHSGKNLIHDGAVPGDANLTKEQREARDHLARGLAFERQNRPELAFEQFSRAAKLDSELTQARYHRGRQLLERGLSVQALQEFDAVVTQDPSFALGHLAKGRVYFSNGLFPEAEKHILAATKHDSKLSPAFELLGILRNHDRRYDEALEAFTTALAITPDVARIYNNMGLTLSMAGRDAEAVDAFRVAIRKGEVSKRSYNNLGLALCRLNRITEAVEAFTAAEDEATAWNNVGYFLFLDGQHTQAVKAFEKAIELKPTFYIRAAENLKRARLAASFGEGHPEFVVPRTRKNAPVVQPASVPATPAVQVQPAVQTSSTISVIPEVVTTSASIAEPVEQTVDNTPSHIEQTVTETPIEAASIRTAELPTPKSSSPSISPQASVTRSEQSRGSGGNHFPQPAEQQQERVYSLHHSSFRTISRAESAVAELEEKGLSAQIVSVTIPEKGEWHRVSVGQHPTAKQAREALAKLTEQFPNMSLRVVRNARFTGQPQRERFTMAENNVALQADETSSPEKRR